MIKVATIAGSDASGGAGLEADLKTFEEYGLYGMAAVTVIACMDPDAEWGHVVFPLPQETLEAQLKTIFKGVSLVAAKSGMLGTEYAVELSRKYISEYHTGLYVLDPVMVCKGAHEALNPELNAAITAKLLPLSAITTPNLFEAAQMAGCGPITTLEGMKEAAREIAGKGAKSVFIKGGSKLSDAPDSKKAVDLFFDGKEFTVLEDELLETSWTHGAGCTTAAAITAGLARGMAPLDAVRLAKKFITASLRGGFPLNKWVGPGNPAGWRPAYGA